MQEALPPDPLSETFRGAMTYHFAPLTSQDYLLHLDRTKPVGTRREFAESLRLDFWEHLYLDDGRPVEILEALTGGALLLLSGWRGEGKSTAIHRAIAEIRTWQSGFESAIDDSMLLPRNLLVHYFDLVGLRYRVAGRTTAGEENDFCGYMAERLEGAYTGAPEAWESFRAYLVLTSRSFHREGLLVARDLGYSIERGDEIDSDVLARAAEVLSDGYRFPSLDAGMRHFDSNPGEVRLHSLLGWLRARGTPAMIVVDNVDQLSPTYQARIGRHLAHLLGEGSGPLWAAILCVRPTTHEAVMAGLDGTRPTLRDIQWNSAPGNPESLTNVRKVLRKRIDYLGELDLADYFIDAQLKKALALRKLRSLRDANTYVHQLAAYIDRASASANELLPALLRWHNGSFRHVMTSLADLVESIILDRNPVIGVAEADVLLEEWKKRSVRREPHAERLARTLAFRQITVGEYLGVPTQSRLPGNTLLFADSNVLGEFDLPYAAIAFLIDMVAKSGATSSLGEAEVIGRGLGLDQTQILLILGQLAGVRPHDDQGFIRFERSHAGELDTPLSQRDLVEILPAGRYLATELFSVCEYLFWCAIYHDRGTTFLPESNHRNTITVGDLANERYRLTVVVNFLILKVLPDFENVLREIPRRSSEEHAASATHVASLLASIAVRLGSGVTAFSTKGSLAGVDLAEIMGPLRAAVDGLSTHSASIVVG